MAGTLKDIEGVFAEAAAYQGNDPLYLSRAEAAKAGLEALVDVWTSFEAVHHKTEALLARAQASS